MLLPDFVLLEVRAAGILEPADMSTFLVAFNHGVSEVVTNNNIHEAVLRDIHAQHSNRRGQVSHWIHVPGCQMIYGYYSAVLHLTGRVSRLLLSSFTAKKLVSGVVASSLEIEAYI